MYSTDFLSRLFSDTSRNWRLFALATYAPISLNAGAFMRLLDAIDKYDRLPGINNECKIGFNVTSSKSHSLNTSFLNPHSIVNTSERIDADVKVSCTPDKSTHRGFVGVAFLKAALIALSGSSSHPAQHSL